MECVTHKRFWWLRLHFAIVWANLPRPWLAFLHCLECFVSWWLKGLLFLFVVGEGCGLAFWRGRWKWNAMQGEPTAQHFGLFGWKSLRFSDQSVDAQLWRKEAVFICHEGLPNTTAGSWLLSAPHHRHQVHQAFCWGLWRVAMTKWIGEGLGSDEEKHGIQLRKNAQNSSVHCVSVGWGMSFAILSDWVLLFFSVSVLH